MEVTFWDEYMILPIAFSVVELCGVKRESLRDKTWRSTFLWHYLQGITNAATATEKYEHSPTTTTTMEALGIDPNSRIVSEEIFSEALRIANEANANQHTVASTPGGLTPSLQKVQIVELLSTGESSKIILFNPSIQ